MNYNQFDNILLEKSLLNKRHIDALDRQYEIDSKGITGFIKNITGYNDFRRANAARRKEADDRKSRNDEIEDFTRRYARHFNPKNADIWRRYVDRVKRNDSRYKKMGEIYNKFADERESTGKTKAVLSATALAAVLGISVYAARKLIKKFKNKKSEN